jgi:hypothetical protein
MYFVSKVLILVLTKEIVVDLISCPEGMSEDY